MNTKYMIVTIFFLFSVKTFARPWIIGDIPKDNIHFIKTGGKVVHGHMLGVYEKVDNEKTCTDNLVVYVSSSNNEILTMKGEDVRIVFSIGKQNFPVDTFISRVEKITRSGSLSQATLLACLEEDVINQMKKGLSLNVKFPKMLKGKEIFDIPEETFSLIGFTRLYKVMKENVKSSEAAANKRCQDVLNIEKLKKVGSLSQQEFKTYFESTKECVDQYRITSLDDLVSNQVNVLLQIDQGTHVIATNELQIFGKRFLSLIKYCADKGAPTCMHNYSSLHNAPPGSVLEKIFKRDLEVFSVWANKAAEAGDPRARFNVIMRISSSDNKSEYFKYDPAKSLKMIKSLKADIKTKYKSYNNLLPILNSKEEFLMNSKGE